MATRPALGQTLRRLRAHLMLSGLPVALILGSAGTVAVAQPLPGGAPTPLPGGAPTPLARPQTGLQTGPLTGWGLNSYGLPGGVDTPSAEVFPDATISVGLSYSTYGRRTTAAFQVIPQVTLALRYARIDSVNLDLSGDDYLKDRSADLRWQVFGEAGWRPAVAVGLQDFLGTGTYSGEYLVATKTFDRVTVSGGLGWGRLAGKARPRDVSDDLGGTLNADDWFSGGARPFASVRYAATDTLSLVAEYSADDYDVEVSQGEDRPKSHVNLGLNYRFADAYQISAYTIGGKAVGAQVSFNLNPKKSPYPSGLEKAPAPVRPRPAPAADPEGWAGTWSQDPTAQPAIQTALGDSLRKEGQILEAMALDATRAEVRIDNRRYPQQAEAIGRTARLMTRALPPSVETFVITSTANGMPTASVVLKRSDVERLENTEAGQIAAAAQVVNGQPRVAGMVPTPGLFPRFRWSLRPSLGVALFDDENSFRYDVAAVASARYEITPGLVLSGSVRQRLFGNADQDAPGTCLQPDGGTAACSVDQYLAIPQAQRKDFNNGVERVRSDGRMYSGNDKPVVTTLTLGYSTKLTDSVYARLTGGLLERAYGGVSAEVLWYPAGANLAIGAEVNRVRKRDYEDSFSFQDYEVTTGHVSAYYDFDNGFSTQLDVGKYLAGDVGATLAVKRRFANGWEVGAFATKTDLSAEEFGEGSFDKGITFSIPIAWAIGTPTLQTSGGTLRSIGRDGGQRVRVEDRLYDTVRASQGVGLYQGWGKFWR